jgi:hypothetical protein
VKINAAKNRAVDDITDDFGAGRKVVEINSPGEMGRRKLTMLVRFQADDVTDSIISNYVSAKGFVLAEGLDSTSVV